jgi:hypothetical protein
LSSSTETQIDELRKIIADEQVSITERKAVAEHLVQLVVDAVPAPGEDHAGVVELRTPWRDDGSLGSLAPVAWRARNEVYGWAPSGPTLPQAIKRVHDGLKFVALLAVVVDEDAHRLEKLAACNAVLHDHLDPRNFYRVNGYDAEKMLSTVKAANATKSTSAGKVPVVRPPQCMADVWQP